MKSYLKFIIPVSFVLFMACAEQNHLAAQKKAMKPDIEYVMMKRTACFGKCPIYYIEIFENGIMRYHGERFVKDSGIYEKNIGAAKADSIIAMFREYRVDTCSEKYEMNVADLPGIYYNFIIDGKETKINNAEFGPDFLKVLAGRLDELGYNVDHSQWKRIKETPKQ